MIILNLLFGLSIIGLGFFIKKYPNTLSGYNTMSAEKKKNVDIDSIASLYKKGMIIIGIITIVCSSVLSLLKLHELAVILLITPLLIGILIITIIERKYDYNKKSKFKKQFPVIIISILILIISISFYASFIPVKIIFNDDSIEFTGQYGLTIKTNQIEKIELINNIPNIKVRTNGLGLGNILKGHFILEDFGRCHLFLHLPNPPYLYIVLRDGNKILFNSTDSLYTKGIYEKLK